MQSHMDYFYGALMNFLELESFGYIDCKWEGQKYPRFH